MRPLIYFLLLLLASPAFGQFSIDLGQENVENGLTTFNGGDGLTIPTTLGGRECRVYDTDNNGHHLYVRIKDANYEPPSIVYVTVWYYDRTGRIFLNYDAGPEEPYKVAQGIYVQEGSNSWKQMHFTLVNPAFDRRENGQSDFRIVCMDPLAIDQVILSETPPDGFLSPEGYFSNKSPTAPPADMTCIQQWQIHEPVSPSVLSDNAYQTARKIGITSLQSYVGWAQLEPNEGQVTYQVYDPVVDQIRNHNLKWLPFIIMAPPVSTPEWWRAQHGVDYVCLEHGTATPIQSLWNPELRSGVTRFLTLFADHYTSDVIEALNFGISGNWGESIYPVGGGFGMGDDHTHGGWWAGDVYAQADFRQAMEKKYQSITTLNNAWQSNYLSFNQIEPFVGNAASNDRARLDMAHWYIEAMTEHAEFWVSTARGLYPDLPIYLCTGGNGRAEYGADFSAQARMCARYGAGIRITNQSDDAFSNFAVTRMVSSATRLYGGYYTTEPAGANTEKGIAARIFDAVTGGARGAYFKSLMSSDSPTEEGVFFRENIKRLIPNEPDLQVAAIMPNTSILLNPALISSFNDRAGQLRNGLNFEYIDENMIEYGLLARFSAVVLLDGSTLEESTISIIDQWIRDGGVFIELQDLRLHSVEGVSAPWLAELNKSTSPLTQALADITLAYGQGYIVHHDGSAFEGILDTIEALHEPAETAPWGFQIAEPIDAQYDAIIADRVGERLYYYNNGDNLVERDVPGAGPVEIPGRTLVVISFASAGSWTLEYYR